MHIETNFVLQEVDKIISLHKEIIEGYQLRNQWREDDDAILGWVESCQFTIKTLELFKEVINEN